MMKNLSTYYKKHVIKIKRAANMSVRYFKLESVTCPPPWKMSKSSRHKKKNTPEDREEQKICKESDGKCFLKTLHTFLSGQSTSVSSLCQISVFNLCCRCH